MALIRPRLTDHHGILSAQEQLDFAIPFFDEDVPLYVDPFLLWKSPSLQDQALHTSLTNCFNHQNWLAAKGKSGDAIENLITASECNEVGLGVSAKKSGKRIGRRTAEEILATFTTIPEYGKHGYTHFEEIQLYVDSIGKDRISDIACNFLKSFLIDYTIEQCQRLSIPLEKISIPNLYDYKTQKFVQETNVGLPVSPDNKSPIILVPKRWLRFSPWINFDDYFSTACPKDDLVNKVGGEERVQVLTYNRQNFGVISSYIEAKERTAADCHNDPLFKQIPVLSAKRKMAEIKKLSTGTEDKADKKYEELASQLLASLLYPHLDFAATQVRAETGATIRDLIFYNNRSVDFLQEVLTDYNSRQLVFELKNVKSIEREHIFQLNRYLTNEFGSFGFLLTRNPPSKAMMQNTIDLWSGQRRCIVCVTDADLELMVNVFESKQRNPIEVLKKKVYRISQKLPSLRKNSMTPDQVDIFEKLNAQLISLHQEMATLSKKSPNDAVNAFKLKLINVTLKQANDFLGEKYRPFESFDLFSEEALPTNSDVSFVISQYIECAEKFRSDNIAMGGGSWRWKVNDPDVLIRTAPPKKLRKD